MGCRARKERDKDSSAGGVKGNASSVPPALRRTKPPLPQQSEQLSDVSAAVGAHKIIMCS